MTLVQRDTISLFVDGLKRYIFTALDVNTRFAFACTYPSASSANGRNFLHKFLQVAPFKVTRIQTDNGAEVQSAFHYHVLDRAIGHVYIRPATPG